MGNWHYSELESALWLKVNALHKVHKEIGSIINTEAYKAPLRKRAIELSKELKDMIKENGAFLLTSPNSATRSLIENNRNLLDDN